MSITSKVEQITPDLATKILDQSKDQVRNRTVSDSHVEWLAEQMKAGKWRTNGEPIIIDDEGYLMDGQHRMYAVAMSGVTIETLVTRGVDRSAFATIDTGSARTVGNVLGIAGETNGNVLAAVLGWVHRWETGQMLCQSRRAGFTSQAALVILKKHAGVRDSISWASQMRSNITLGLVPMSALSFLHYVFVAFKPNKAVEFFEHVGDLRMDSAGTPTRTLRDWLLKNERSRQPATPVEFMAVFVKAWRAFLDGETPKGYIWRRTGASPESFPLFPGERNSRGKAVRGMVSKELAAKQRKAKA